MKKNYLHHKSQKNDLSAHRMSLLELPSVNFIWDSLLYTCTSKHDGRRAGRGTSMWCAANKHHASQSNMFYEERNTHKDKVLLIQKAQKEKKKEEQNEEIKNSRQRVLKHEHQHSKLERDREREVNAIHIVGGFNSTLSVIFRAERKNEKCALLLIF